MSTQDENASGLQLGTEVDRSVNPRVNESFRKLVKRELAERGWTQRKLAEEADTDEGNVSRFFRGKVGREVVGKIASVLGLADPFTLEENADHEFLTIGSRMRSQDPEKYEVIMTALRAWDANERAWEKITTLVPRSKGPDRNDR